MSDSRPGVSVPPPVTAAQRSVLYAVRRRGEATVVDVAEMLDMTPSRRPPAPHRPRRRRAAGGRRGVPCRRPAGTQRADVLHHAGGRGAVPAGLWRADQPAAPLRARRRGDGRLRAPPRRPHRRSARPPCHQAQLQGQGQRAGPHPRRGRLPGRRRADRSRRVPHRRAQLRHLRRRPRAPAGAARPSSSSCTPPSRRPTSSGSPT